MTFTSLTTWFLSRFSFVATHIVFFIFVNFVLGNPAAIFFPNNGFPSLDVPIQVPVSASCQSLDWAAVQYNVIVFLVFWWFPHSALSRNVVKKAIGTYGTSLDRPLFAFLAPISWGITLFLWKPIDTCSRFDLVAVATANPIRFGVHGLVFLLATIEILGLFFLLPHHVFGTDRYTWVNNKPVGAQSHDIIVSFPYALVRHPAAAGLLWIYWGALPSHTYNHLLLTGLWTVFIVVGTLLFEEGGLKDSDEFGAKYAFYTAKVNAFIPSIWSIKLLFGLVDQNEARQPSTKKKN